MIWLSTSTISRLRDQLQARGQRPSVVMAGVTPEVAETLALAAEYGPLCEAMYIMMSADGEVTNDEREVLRGALRNLSSDTLRSAQIESLLDDASKKVAASGRDERLREVAEMMAADEARAEVAFVLAAAIAFADGTIADEENDTLNVLATRLGINEARANQLLDAVDADMSDKVE